MTVSIPVALIPRTAEPLLSADASKLASSAPKNNSPASNTVSCSASLGQPCTLSSPPSQDPPPPPPPPPPPAHTHRSWWDATAGMQLFAQCATDVHVVQHAGHSDVPYLAIVPNSVAPQPEFEREELFKAGSTSGMAHAVGLTWLAKAVRLRVHESLCTEECCYSVIQCDAGTRCRLKREEECSEPDVIFYQRSKRHTGGAKLSRRFTRLVDKVEHRRQRAAPCHHGAR